jgi:membrane protease subunit (stomatin/prohibitin family)
VSGDNFSAAGAALHYKPPPIRGRETHIAEIADQLSEAKNQYAGRPVNGTTVKDAGDVEEETMKMSKEKTEKPNFCLNCGKPVLQDDNFCSRCGKSM